MKFTEAVIRFVAGGSIVLLVSILGKTKNSYLSGLALMFPAVTLVGFYFLSSQVQGKTLQNAVLFSIFSIPAVLSFLITLYFTLYKYPIWKSLSLAILVWLIFGIIIVFLNYYIKFVK